VTHFTLLSKRELASIISLGESCFQELYQSDCDLVILQTGDVVAVSITSVFFKDFDPLVICLKSSVKKIDEVACLHNVILSVVDIAITSIALATLLLHTDGQ
jgi:hypothetical protein